MTQPDPLDEHGPDPMSHIRLLSQAWLSSPQGMRPSPDDGVAPTLSKPPTFAKTTVANALVRTLPWTSETEIHLKTRLFPGVRLAARRTSREPMDAPRHS